jgi:hypothetical protein
MELTAAFLLGLLGSLHCAGMCGPLICALPRVGDSRISAFAGRLLYNAGRISLYTMLGLLCGALGKSLAIAGFQKWISLIAGLAILVGLVASSRLATRTPVWKLVQHIKTSFARMLQQRSYSSLFLLGTLNGLLPCGLVYAACAAAMSASGAGQGALAMFLFGLGTLPVMLGIGFAQHKIRAFLGQRLRLLNPAAVALVGLMLVVRGMALGIPYLSPSVDHGHAACSHCATGLHQE